MSAQPDYEPVHFPELQIVTSEEQNRRIAEIAFMHPARAYELTDESPKVLFQAAELALHNTHDLQKKAGWIGVMHKAILQDGNHL